MAVTRADRRTVQGGGGLTRLWFAIVAAPLAWLIDLEASYATVSWACAHHRRDVVFVMPLAALAVIAMAAWPCRSARFDLRRGADFDGGSVEDRSRFLGVIALLMCATFALLIITTFAARFLLSPCE